jgi:hypothetical protein
MNFESVVNDAKIRFEDVSARAQGVAEVSVETFKKANDIVVPAFQSIVKKNTDVAKSFIENGKASFGKVRTDGLKAVAANPVEYLPAGRDQFASVLSDSVEVTTKASGELLEVLKSAYEAALARINGQAPVVAKAKKQVKKATASTKTAATKTVKRAKATGRKTAAKVEKSLS